MVLETTLVYLKDHWLVLGALVLVGYLQWQRYGNGLNKYPGPMLANYTGWWRFFDVYQGKAQYTQIGLHNRHGDVVRLAPNVLSFSNPKAIKDIYGLNQGFSKTEFYPIQNYIANGRRIASMFSTQDEAWHDSLRRCVNFAFSMSSLMSYEPLVDSTIQTFLTKTDELFCGPDKSCDFGRWLQYYAFDVIGEITFGKRLGFLDENRDVHHIIKAISEFMAYASPVGQQPWLDRYVLHKNPIKMFLARHTSLTRSGTSPVARFAQEQIDERRKSGSTVKVKFRDQELSRDKADLLHRFLDAHKEHPDFMTDSNVLNVTTSLINAGSDTTASSLGAVFYYLLRSPDSYRKLLEEIDPLFADGTITPSTDKNLISWTDAQKMPYLDAVIQESFRLFPAVGLLLERQVPQAGAIVWGERVPAGTIVGCNAWVLHRRPDVFGEDAQEFRPERWLEADAKKLKEMKAAMFHFGAGSRSCIGKNISILEVYKLVPNLLRHFKVCLAFNLLQTLTFTDPAKDWQLTDWWFVRQHDFHVKFEKRLPVA
ncbi:MAG: hypothetical protein M1831_005324 [Alyxoria varia]|nr:MAG: hypothetical protein M1831_005324 [Alyxoria varia]